jgi:hypothetical protein
VCAVCVCQVRKQTVHPQNYSLLSWNGMHRYFSDKFLCPTETFFFQLRIRSDVTQRMYSMPLTRRGRPRPLVRSPRHVAPVLLVVYWLRRAIKRFASNTGSKYQVPAASYEVMCAHVRQTVYAFLPGIRNSAQWRTHSSCYTRVLCGLIDDNVLIAWSQDVQYSSPFATHNLAVLLAGSGFALCTLTFFCSR